MKNVKPSDLHLIEKPTRPQVEYRVDGVPNMRVRVGAKGELGFSVMYYSRKTKKRSRVSVQVGADRSQEALMHLKDLALAEKTDVERRNLPPYVAAKRQGLFYQRFFPVHLKDVIGKQKLTKPLGLRPDAELAEINREVEVMHIEWERVVQLAEMGVGDGSSYHPKSHLTKSPYGIASPTPYASDKNGKQIWMYLITNSAMPGWVKAGQSIDIDIRAKTLDTGAPRDYSVQRRIYLPHGAADKDTHETLAKFAGASKREWFFMPVDQAEEVAQCVLDGREDDLAGMMKAEPPSVLATVRNSFGDFIKFRQTRKEVVYADFLAFS